MGWNRLLPFFRKKRKRLRRQPWRETRHVAGCRNQYVSGGWRIGMQSPSLHFQLSLSLGRLTSIPLVIGTSSIQPSTTTEQRGRREALALLILDDNKSDKSIASSRYNLFNTHTLPCVQPLRRLCLILQKHVLSPFGRFDDT
jgi:hypothetical protein